MTNDDGTLMISYDIANYRAGWNHNLDGVELVCIGCGKNVIPVSLVNDFGGVTVSQTDYDTMYEVTKTSRIIHGCSYGRKTKRGNEG